MLSDVRDLLRGTFPKKAFLSGIGEKFVISDFKAFRSAIFTVKDSDGEHSSQTTIEKLGIKEGDVLSYAGRGSGNKKMYKVAFGEDFENVEIHMSHLADGKPNTFGLEKYVDSHDAILGINPERKPS